VDVASDHAKDSGEEQGMSQSAPDVGPPIVPRAGLSAVIAERLLRLMRGGHLQEGSKLPAERELAAALGVSRTMVREALAALQLAGLVERKQGLGTIVTRTLTASTDFEQEVEAGSTIAELITVRMALDLGIAHLLCDQRDRDLREIVTSLDSMRLAVSSRSAPEDYILSSIEYHVALGRATRRQTLVGIQRHMMELMRPHVWLLASRYDWDLAKSSLALHERIFEALDGRDLIAALAELRTHYRSYPVLGARLTDAALQSVVGEKAIELASGHDWHPGAQGGHHPSAREQNRGSG
jgi:GntR family transcriptional repressor for pyruvate dehydrogenase complex